MALKFCYVGNGKKKKNIYIYIYILKKSQSLPYFVEEAETENRCLHDPFNRIKSVQGRIYNTFKLSTRSNLSIHIQSTMMYLSSG